MTRRDVIQNLFRFLKEYDFGRIPVFRDSKPDGVDVYMPKKKPKGKELTPEEKQENKRISGIRIKVEHVIGGMKKCSIVKERFRCHKFGFEDMVILIAC